MMLTLCVLLGALAGLCALVLCGAAVQDPPAPPLPARLVGTDLPTCREAWLELPDEATYDHRRFDAQIDHMLRSTARWQQAQDRRAS